GAWRQADTGAVPGDGRGARAPGEAARDPAALRSDDQGDLGTAAALRAARGAAPVPAARASALSRRVGLSRPALPKRRACRRTCGPRRLVGSLRASRPRGARSDAVAR